MPHLLIAQLVAALGPEPRDDLLDAFWAEVERRGTPLLEPHPSGEGFTATFLYRLPVRRIAVFGNYTDVQVVFDGDYVKGIVDLEHIDGTTVWHGEAHIPDRFTGEYCFNLWDRDGRITEDIHEPWAMSFADEYNPLRAAAYGSAYGRNLVVTTPARIRADVARGEVVEFGVDARLLMPPHLERRRAELSDRQMLHQVWAYRPADEHRTGDDLPCVLLLDGQYLEHVDLPAILDTAIADGRIPPVAVVTSGWNDGNRNSWGWRHGYGPASMAEFLDGALWSALVCELGVRPPVHLVAYEWTARRAVGTAAGSALVGSVTLLDPWDPPEDMRVRYLSSGDAPLLTEVGRLGEVQLVLGWPEPRSGAFAWHSETLRALAETRPAVRVPLRDQNIYAATDALIESIAATVGGRC